MRVIGGIVPFVGFATRYVTAEGDCLATRDHAFEHLMQGGDVSIVEVFEISWFDVYWWPWYDDFGLVVSKIAAFMKKKDGD